MWGEKSSLPLSLLLLPQAVLTSPLQQRQNVNVNLLLGQFFQFSPQFSTRGFIRDNHKCPLLQSAGTPQPDLLQSVLQCPWAAPEPSAQSFLFPTYLQNISPTGTNSLLHHQPRDLQVRISQVSATWTRNSCLCTSHGSHCSRGRMTIVFSPPSISK